MAGTKSGGLKAAATNKARHGENFYRELGHRGGSAKTNYPKGFAAMTREQRVKAGKKGGLVRGEQYKRSKIEGTWVTKKPNSANSDSITKTSRKGTCLECGKQRVLIDGFCQKDYKRLGKLGRALVHEAEEINRGEKSNNYETVVVPGYHLDDKPEFIIDRSPSLFERVFGRRHHR